MARTNADTNLKTVSDNPQGESGQPSGARTRAVRGWGLMLHPLELVLLVAFLALVFLLGVFPLKDTDFWWHLRTGDWILANGKVPRADLYTYTVPEARWVDLHWGFQVLLSIGYGLGGVPLLNIAKCLITSAAMAVLVLGCRRPGWPFWVSLLSWCPALLVLAGRMYVRPETISLWWMSLVMLVVFHWRKYPRIMWLLPPVFLGWVNTQGLFVLGFVILAMGLAEVAADPASWQRSQRPWWSRTVACIGLSVIATLFNPYGFRGLIFPLELAGTMGNPVFRSIGELTPIPQFIQSLGFKQFPLHFSIKSIPVALEVIATGFTSFPLPLKLHLGSMLLCFLSFVVPLTIGFIQIFMGVGSYRVADETIEPIAPEKSKSGRSRSKARQAGDFHTVRPPVSAFLRFSLFRFLMFVFFSLLSFQATRNSHQFAAVIGTVTAANFAEWASLYGVGQKPSKKRRTASLVNRLSPGNSVALAVVLLLLVWVGSSQFYNDAGEGRTIGWGEEPLWFPHAAVKASAGEGLPDKFASFHNGHAALYDYYWGPDRKVYTDARLEVIGPVLYQDQIRLGTALNMTEPAWKGLVAKAGRPVILADHLANSGVSVTLMSASDYACIHFDPVAAVFAPLESLPGSNRKRFDFLKAHYDPQEFHALSRPERLALARALRNLGGGLAASQRDDLVRPLVLSGIGLCSDLTAEDPTLSAAWKLLGQMLNISLQAAPREQPPTRFQPLDDLDAVRGIYALKRAIELNPEDFSGLYTLAMIQRNLVQFDQELESLAKLITLTPTNTMQSAEIENAVGRIATLRQLMGINMDSTSRTSKTQPSLSSSVMIELAKPLPSPGSSRAEIERNVNSLLKNGLVRRAAETLNASLPLDDAPTELLDELGSLWLWLGRPEDARQAFGRIKIEPLRQSRLAACWIATNHRQEALKLLDEAAAFKPTSGAENSGTFLEVIVLKTRLAMESGNLDSAKSGIRLLDEIPKTGPNADLVERLKKSFPRDN